MRVTPENIQHLEPNEVFCYGSNESGRHGRGAAKTALRFGAKYGQGVGFNGQTYAIPTKDCDLKVLPLEVIGRYVGFFIDFAKLHYDKKFLVTAIGTGLAGYKPKDIAPFFQICTILDNIYLPESFWEVILGKQSRKN